MLIGYVYFLLHCKFVQFMQFPVIDFVLDHYVSEPFNYYLNSQAFFLLDKNLRSVCQYNSLRRGAGSLRSAESELS